MREFFSNLLIPGWSLRWLEPLLTAAQGARLEHPSPHPGPGPITEHARTLRLGQCRHTTTHFICTSLRCGKKPKNLEKNPYRHRENANSI